MTTKTEEFPRRNRIDLNTPAELAIRNAVQEVEKAGADVKLTEAVILLDKARELVADFIDTNAHEQIIGDIFKKVIDKKILSISQTKEEIVIEVEGGNELVYNKTDVDSAGFIEKKVREAKIFKD